MSISYCDNCGEIITDGNYAPGQESLCAGCRGTSNPSADPAGQAEPDGATPGTSDTASADSHDPYAPCATMVMSPEDVKLASETDLTVTPPPADSEQPSPLSPLACGLSPSEEPEPPSKLVDDTGAPPPADDFEDDFSMSSMLESDELDLFSSDTIARRKAAPKSKKNSSLSLVDEEDSGEDRRHQVTHTPAGSVDDGMSVFNETLRLTGEFATSARVPDDTASPPTPALPAGEGLKTTWNTGPAPGDPSPPTAVMEPPRPTAPPPPSSYSSPASAGLPVSDDLTAPMPSPAMTITPAPRPSVNRLGDKWQLKCPQCSSKLALRPVTQRSRISCPRCSACVRLEPDGTYKQLDTPTAASGQRVAHVAAPGGTATSAPVPPTPAAPEAPTAMMAPPNPAAAPSQPASAAAVGASPTTDRLQWSISGRVKPRWRTDLRDLCWLAALATPLAVGVSIATGAIDLDLGDLGAECQAKIRALLARIGG